MRWRDADESCCRPCSAPTFPRSERLSCRDSSCATCGTRPATRGTSRHVAAIVETVTREARAGDLVVVMSNGGFDDIHKAAVGASSARVGVGDERSAGVSRGRRRGAVGLPPRSIPRSTPARASRWRGALGREQCGGRARRRAWATAPCRAMSIRCDGRCGEAGIGGARAGADDCRMSAAIQGRLIDVPVCYGGEFGPDLADVAASPAARARGRRRRRHAAVTYRVFSSGSSRDLPYLGPLDPRLRLPRRPRPPQVPPGSVAIAAADRDLSRARPRRLAHHRPHATDALFDRVRPRADRARLAAGDACRGSADHRAASSNDARDDCGP